MIHFIMMLPGVNTLFSPRPTDDNLQLLNRGDRPLCCGKKRSRKTQVDRYKGGIAETQNRLFHHCILTTSKMYDENISKSIDVLYKFSSTQVLTCTSARICPHICGGSFIKAGFTWPTSSLLTIVHKSSQHICLLVFLSSCQLGIKYKYNQQTNRGRPVRPVYTLCDTC